MRCVVIQHVTLPPLHSSSQPQAVVDRVEQVLVDTDVVFSGTVNSNHVTLENIIQIVGDLRVEHDAVRVSVASSSPEITCGGDIGEGCVVA